MVAECASMFYIRNIKNYLKFHLFLTVFSVSEDGISGRLVS